MVCSVLHSGFEVHELGDVEIAVADSPKRQSVVAGTAEGVAVHDGARHELKPVVESRLLIELDGAAGPAIQRAGQSHVGGAASGLNGEIVNIGAVARYGSCRGDGDVDRAA